MSLEGSPNRAPGCCTMRNLVIVTAAFAIVSLLSGCARQAYYYSPYPEYSYSPRYAYPEYSYLPGPNYPPRPELYGDDRDQVRRSRYLRISRQSVPAVKIRHKTLLPG